MSRERWLRFRVRLVRGDHNRVDSIEFMQPFESVSIGEPEIEGSVPETARGGAEETTESPATAEAAPTTEEGSSAPEGLASRIAGVLEWLGDLSSGRWVWDPINSQIAEWEAELDRISERGEGGTAGQLMSIPVSVLFTILSSITGMLDLMARIIPANVTFQGTATGIRATAGQYSQEDFLSNATAVGTEAFDIITLGLRGAILHIREGIQEANVFRVTQAVSEIILAALAIFGIVRGLRGRLAARRAAGGAETTTGAPAEAPVEAPAETRAAGLSRSTVRRPVTDVSEEQRLRDKFVSGRRRGSVNESFDPEGFQAEWEFRGGEGNSPPAYITDDGAFWFDSRRVGRAPGELVSEGVSRRRGSGTPRTTSTAGGSRIRRLVSDITETQRLRDDYVSEERRGAVHESFDPEGFQAEWEFYGGQGDVPPAFVSSDGAFWFDSRRVGRPPAGLLAEGVSRCRGPASAQPPAERPGSQPAEDVGEAATRPQFVERSDDVARARELVEERQAARRPAYGAAHDSAMQGHWERAGGSGNAPVAFFRSDGMLVYNRSAL